MSGLIEQFSYVERDPALGAASLAPMLPVKLIGRQSFETSGPLDSGATINVLPFDLGNQLGFDWDQENRSVQLSGNLALVGGACHRRPGGRGKSSSSTARLCLGEVRCRSADFGPG